MLAVNLITAFSMFRFNVFHKHFVVYIFIYFLFLEIVFQLWPGLYAMCLL